MFVGDLTALFFIWFLIAASFAFLMAYIVKKLAKQSKKWVRVTTFVISFLLILFMLI
jgi:hypothetical protein